MMEKTVLTPSEVNALPPGSVVRCVDSPAREEIGSVITIGVGGRPVHWLNPDGALVGLMQVYTGDFELLHRAEVPPKVGDILTGEQATKLPPLTVLRRKDGRRPIVVITAGLIHAKDSASLVFGDGSAGYHWISHCDEFELLYLPEAS